MKLRSLIFVSWIVFASSTTLLADPPPLGSAAAKWPGVKLEVAKIERVGANKLLVAVRVRGESGLREPVLIGTAEVIETKSGPVESGSTDTPAPKQATKYEPFSLLPAKLIDQTTKLEYSAEGKLPAEPYWGDSEIVATIRKNSWFQLAACFKAPPPLPLDSNGKMQPQKVTFVFAGGEPIKDVLLP